MAHLLTAVIGAGPAGCSAAYRLKKAGRHVIVLEKAAFLGGRTYTHRNNGLILDSGAAFFTSFYALTKQYIRQFHLHEQVRRMEGKVAFVYQRERAVLRPGTLGGFVSFPYCRWRDKVKLFLYALKMATKRYQFNIASAANLAQYDTCSIAERARSELGETLYQFFVRPSIEPFWYFSCEDVSQALMLALHAQGVRAKLYRIESGMDQLCHALLNGINTRVESEVFALLLNSDGTIQVRYRYGPARDEMRIDVEDVVVATTAGMAHRLTAQLPDSLVDCNQRGYLLSQKYVPNIHCAYSVEQETHREERIALPVGPGVHRVAALSFHQDARHNYARTMRGQLVSVYLSATTSQALLTEAEETIADNCWRIACEWDEMLPMNADPEMCMIRRDAIPLHEVGRFRRAAQFLARQKRPVVFAGDYLATATIEGALHTGTLAADTLLGVD